MTPYEIEIAMWYYSRASDWDGPSKGNWLHTSTMEMMCREGLLNRDFSTVPIYTATKRLYAFVESLQKTPLPIRAWIDKRDQSVLQYDP